MSQATERTPVTEDTTYRGEFKYGLRSTALPYYTKKMGVIEGEVRVRDGKVYVYEDADSAERYDRPQLAASLTADRSLFTDHEYDINWTRDDTLVVGGRGAEKLVVTFYRRDDQ